MTSDEMEAQLRECVHWAEDSSSLAHIADHLGLVKGSPWPDDLTVDEVIGYFRKMPRDEQVRALDEIEECPW